MLAMNGSAISHNVDSLIYTSYKSVFLNANIHNIVIQNCMKANIHAK